eukprot:41671_1
MASVLDVITQLINTFDDYNSHTTKCICGINLLKVNDASHLYNACYSCNVCGNEQMNALYHCPQEYNIFHPDGYSICIECDLSNNTNKVVFDPIITSSNTKFQPQVCCEQHSNCQTLHTFVNIMKEYNENQLQITKNMDNAQLTSTLDHYLHLIHQHNQDEQFEAIYNQLGFCDVTKCAIFMRNNRNRMIINEINDAQYTKCNVIYDIIDKMHCYFQHCYDIGNQLSIKEKNVIHSEVKYNTDLCDAHLLNNKTAQIAKILQSKRDRHKDIYYKFNNALHNKYNQLFCNINEQKSNNIQQTAMYSFGYPFEYGYDGEAFQALYIPNCRKILPKYASFKQELTQNTNTTTTILVMDEFNNEYKKAMIHFKSFYFKQNNTFKTYTTE